MQRGCNSSTGGRSGSSQNGAYFKKPITEKLRCAICSVYKPHSAYANNRMNTLRFYGMDHPTAMKQLICASCVPAPVTELECHGPSANCTGQKKGLDAFSKQQRKHPDTAMCKVCVYKVASTQPGRMRENSDEEDNDDDHHHDDERYSGTSSVSGAGSVAHSMSRNDDDKYKTMSDMTNSLSRVSISTGGSSVTRGPASVSTRSSNWPKAIKVPRGPIKPQMDADHEVKVAQDDDSDSDWEM